MPQPPCPQPRRWRRALSARIDGEPSPVPAAQLDAHLTSCRDCREWLARARSMTRELREDGLRAPDLTSMLVNASEAHICACHTGGECACTDCQCPTCTCRPASRPAEAGGVPA